MNKKFNKNIIIEQLTIIRNYEMINCKPLKVKAYNKVIDNLIAYPNDIKDLKDLKEIKGIGVKILALLTELYETGKISYIKETIKKDKQFIPKKTKKQEEFPFNKEIIIDNLTIIRDYEVFNNEIFKFKAYNKVIDNLYDFPNDINDLRDLKEIKGIGDGMLRMIAELRKNGKISYIENVIKKDKSYKIPIKIKRTSSNKFNKKLIIDNLMTIRDYETYKNEKYKVKAYSNVINNILIFKDDINDLKDLKKIDGIGKSIFDKIKELYDTGKISYIENNINNDDIYVFKQELLSIYGIGPVNANKIVDSGIRSMDELKKNLKLLNAKQQIGLKYFNDFKKRIPLDEYKNHISILNKDLKKNKLIFDFVGSYRRGSSSMGDIDLLIMENPKFNFKDYISKLIDSNYIIEVLAFGKNKFMGIVKLPNQTPRRLDILIAPISEYYYSLLYFTGSNIFNIGLRHYVKINFDLSLSEHGFGKNINKNINSEEDIFKFLKLKYVKPKERDNFYI
jgi:DNA polymerase/3'-5' exonuclease PolX